MKTLELKPEKRELYKLNEFIHKEIKGCDFKTELMVEEIFVNIVNYSGCSNIIVTVDNDNTIQFADDGVKFNPLEHESSDPPENIDEAEVGGLGIPFIKEIAVNVSYEYRNNKNHLVIKKK